MQEFTTDIKGMVKGLRPTRMARNTGMLVDCLNMKPVVGEKLVSQSFLQFPEKFIDVLETNTAPIAREDFFYLYINETVSGNVLDNDADWNGQSFTVVSANEDEANVGLWVTVNDGGDQFELSADGSFEFSPGEGQELGLNETYTVVISYEISDGTDVSTGTINVVVWGVYVEPIIIPPVTEPYFILYVTPEDTEITARTGQFCETVGMIGLDGGQIVKTGVGEGHGIYVGTAGEFDFLSDGTTSWTAEFIMTRLTTEFLDDIFLEITLGEGPYLAFFLRTEDDAQGGQYGIMYLESGDPIIGHYANISMAPPYTSPLPKYDWMSGDEHHIAIVFDKDADAFRCYIEGNFICEGTKTIGKDYFAMSDATLMLFGSQAASNTIQGALKGVRITKAVLYEGDTQESFTPPTEF